MPKETWNKSFSDENYVYGVEPNVFIKAQANEIKENSKVACLAEGEGRNAVYLAKLGHHVTAYDISDVGLKKSKQLAEKNKVTIQTVEQDLVKEKLPKEAYDAAILVFGHVHKDDQKKFIENAIQSVKKGGKVIFELYSTDQLTYQTGGPGHIDFLYEPKLILELIKSYDVKHFYFGEAERFEGPRHNGLCSVVQVVIEK